ncbi:hypothetical protein [Bacteroides sp. 51]|nr:hypothetical protein [Bacteroides sp. 51]
MIPVEIKIFGIAANVIELAICVVALSGVLIGIRKYRRERKEKQRFNNQK